MTEAAFSSSPQASLVLEEFSTRFTKQAGMLYPVKLPEEAVSVVNDLISSRGRGESCCSNELSITTGGTERNLSPLIKASMSFQHLHQNPRKAAGLLDVGITKADYGIAETGTIVDISYSDEHRLLSSFSRVHVALLERSAILARLSDLSSKVKELLRPGVEPKPSISFIGGPSRTSDIELKSVLGVHGPHEVHVVLL
jgi:L-lactate utilization protein LutC